MRLYQGDYAQAEVFGEDPLAVAQRWVAAGAPRLHLVDLDGAKAGQPINTEVIRAIAQSVPVPVQVGGGLRDRESVRQLLDLGVERVILGTVAVEQPQLTHSVVDYTVTSLAFFGQSMPTFWTGLMAIAIFSVALGWFPTGGARVARAAAPMASAIARVPSTRLVSMRRLTSAFHRAAPTDSPAR